MCGRYSIAAADPAVLRARFGLGEAVVVERRFNVAPTDGVLAVIGGDPPHGEILRWGLVPHWAEDLSIGVRAINARAETVASKPLFRESFATRRCLVIADGFYEWKRLESRKQPWHITLAGGEPFAFAGLWASWQGLTGETVRSAAIITTTASPRIAPIHDRMPVILPRAAEATWLDPAAGSDELQDLLVPLPDALTAARPVSTAVNDARYDGPACLEDPVEPAPPQAPRLF